MKTIGSLGSWKRPRKHVRLSTVILRRMLFVILIVLCTTVPALMLTGCATSTPPSLVRPPLPANLLTLCPGLTPMEGITGEVMLRKIIEVSEQYYNCADGKKKLIEAVGN